MTVADVLRAIVNEIEAGRRVAVCAIVATRGSTPQPAGTIVCVDEAATMHGTLGGGCVEAEIRKRAHGMLSESAHGGAEESRGPTPVARPNESNRPSGELVTVELDHDFGFDDGMICGGRMDVAVSVLSPSTDLTPIRQAIDRLSEGEQAELSIEVTSDGKRVEYRVPLDAQPRLVIVGAGHISRMLAPVALQIGFRVFVLDDRADYASAVRFPIPIETRVGDIAMTLRGWPIDARTYVVIVTRGHRHDEAALRAVVDSPARYVGMIGSKRKIEVTFDDLRRSGVSDERLGRVRAPIGMDIRAVTAEEIAVSIAAELISVRRTTRRRSGEGPVPFDGG